MVFATGKGNPESLSNFYTRCWYALFKRVDVPYFNFHMLRHFHASMLIASGANPKEVQTEMGHSSIQMSYDQYGHLFNSGSESRKQRAEELAADLL